MGLIWLTLSSLCPQSAINKSPQYQKKSFWEPRAAGWEASLQLLCYSTPYISAQTLTILDTLKLYTWPYTTKPNQVIWSFAGQNYQTVSQTGFEPVAAEDDGVDGADPGTCQHGHHQLQDHGHVDGHAITLEVNQGTGESLALLVKSIPPLQIFVGQPHPFFGVQGEWVAEFPSVFEMGIGAE